MSERPLHDFIDMEAYDVVSGETYRNLLEQFEALREAATALYERVEMDESVGVCLSSRVESLNLGAVLSNPASRRGPHGEGTTAEDRRKDTMASNQESGPE